MRRPDFCVIARVVSEHPSERNTLPLKFIWYLHFVSNKVAYRHG